MDVAIVKLVISIRLSKPPDDVFRLVPSWLVWVLPIMTWLCVWSNEFISVTICVKLAVSCWSLRSDKLLLFLSSLSLLVLLDKFKLILSALLLLAMLLVVVLSSFMQVVFWVFLRHFSCAKFSLSSSTDTVSRAAWVVLTASNSLVSILYFLNQLWLNACSIVNRCLKIWRKRKNYKFSFLFKIWIIFTYFGLNLIRFSIKSFASDEISSK